MTDSVFKTYSRRTKGGLDTQSGEEEKAQRKREQRTRVRIALLYEEVLDRAVSEWSDDKTESKKLEKRFYKETQRRMCMAYGWERLTDVDGLTWAADLQVFLHQCSMEQAFDFVEQSFRTGRLPGLQVHENGIVARVNEILRAEGVRLRLTEQVKTKLKAGMVKVTQPLFVPAPDEVIHSITTTSGLKALEQQEFQDADNEMREALQELRRGRFRECLTRCGNTIEAITRTLYDGPLEEGKQPRVAQRIEHIGKQRGLPGFMIEAMKVPTQLRNTRGSAHATATGATERDIEQLAHYGIAITGTTVALLVEIGNKKGHYKGTA